MAFEVTELTNSLKNAIDKEPVLILEIEGSQYIYGTSPILENIKWDDDRITWDNLDGYTWDGVIERADSKPYINWKRTTKDLTQQLIIDKGGSGSVSTMDIAIVDFRGEVAKDFALDRFDPLGKKADVYLGLKGGVHPTDSIPIIRSGYVDDTKYSAGLITISVSHSENLKRQSILEQHQSQTTDSLDIVVTTIPVTTTLPFTETADALTSYIRIDDEIMEVVSKTSSEFEVIRGSLGTLVSTHDDEAEVTSYYKLKGLPIELALKLMLSKEGNSNTVSPINVTATNVIRTGVEIQGAVVVDDRDVQLTTGLAVGDLVTLSGTTSNDGTYPIVSFGTIEGGSSYLVLNAPSLISETGLSISLEYRSAFNVLKTGLGLDVSQVDTDAFLDVQGTFFANFIENDYPIKDTIENCKEFIDLNLFLPQAIYTIPRKAKISCKYTAPPFSVDTIPVLNLDNLTDVTKILMRRSTHKYLYNEVVFRYNEGILEDKLFDKVIRVNSDSISRIPTGRRELKIEARGIGRSSESVQVLDANASRILNRFKFGARYITGVKPLFEVGMTLEIGDVVFFGGSDMQLVDINTGERDLPVGQYEIINKKTNINKGEVSLQLLETGFSFEDSAFGVYSPSSVIASGSTINKVCVSKIFDCSEGVERDKWVSLIGAKIRIRSEDYTYDESNVIARLDNTTNNCLIMETPLPSAPLAGYIIELDTHDLLENTDVDNFVSLKYTFTMPSGDITSIVSPTELTLDDVSGFEVGMLISVHSIDYTQNSSDVLVDDIVGNTITLNTSLDITPMIGDRLEAMTFPTQKGYRFL